MVHDRMMAQAEDASNYDFLTGALSRRAFVEAGRKELKRFARNGLKFTMLIFDVDHFKQINDTYGHASGDEVLINIVAEVNKLLRTSDHFGRIGGEEFALLLPETDEIQAPAIAERVRHALDRRAPAVLDSEQHTLRPTYTVSIGFAVVDHAECLEDLMARADAALYDAKTAGRNMAVFANSRLPCQQNATTTQVVS